MRILASIFVFVGAWTCWSSIRLFGDSDHMGSRVVNAEDWGGWEYHLNATPLPTAEKERWLNELRSLRKNGMLGFTLLGRSLAQSFVCGATLILAGAILFKKKKPNQSPEPTAPSGRGSS